MDCINSLLQAANAEQFFTANDAVSIYQNPRSQYEDINSMSQTVPNVEDVSAYADSMQFPDDLSAFGKFSSTLKLLRVIASLHPMSGN